MAARLRFRAEAKAWDKAETVAPLIFLRRRMRVPQT
jgi:hypothetical protein